jgi:carbonic anhydrase
MQGSILLKGKLTLLVTCSCCQVSFDEFFSAEEFIITSNIGNVVPPYLESPRSDTATSIEYAVGLLGARRIAICGHTDCQILRAILSKTHTSGTVMEKWLENIPQLPLSTADRDELNNLKMLVDANVTRQLEHLKTYPVVSSSLKDGSLKVEGWVLQETSGFIAQYDADNKRFVIDPTQKIFPSRTSRTLH